MYPNLYDQNPQNYNSYKKKNGPEDNYYGGIHRDQGHKNNNNIPHYGDDKFQKTKNKIKVTIYKNGFILNNGPFRDKTIPENQIFLEEVEKGLIPQEIRKKGINDLGILLENRKNELYVKKAVNPITETLSAYIYGNTNNNYNPNINTNLNNNYNPNINTNLNNINYMPNNNMNFNPNIDPNIKINPPIILDPGQDIPLHFQEPFIINQSNNYQNQRKRQRVESLTPIEARKKRKNIFIEKNGNEKEKEENFQLKKRESLSAPKKKEEKKFKTFASLLREKEEEEKKKKANPQNKQNGENEEEKEEKKFQAFTGTGQLIGNINTQGLHVNKDVKNIVDEFSPICTFSIRLFNGEIVKCEFNYTQTLRDIYYYVQKISGSKNFHLLDGFPPKPLRDYNKQIGELHLDNTILTQKIKEN